LNNSTKKEITLAQINLQKLKESLAESVIKVAGAQSRAVVESMLNFEADIKQRVFTDGLDANGQKIGTYSTKPFYASLNQSSQIRASSLKGRGKKRGSRDAERSGPKNVRNKFTGRVVPADRKTMYLPGGYLEFRGVVGRQNKTVDLNLTGSLQGDIRLGQSNDSVQVAFTTDKQKDIASGNEERFQKTIFSPSDREIENIEDAWEIAGSEAFLSSLT
jgi:hypothetical protein